MENGDGPSDVNHVTPAVTPAKSKAYHAFHEKPIDDRFFTPLYSRAPDTTLEVSTVRRESTANADIPKLGDLEVAVLEHVWAVGDAAAKDAHAAIGIARGISLNTVQSALERLFRKSLLKRVKAGHSFRYSAAIGREELVAGLITEVLGRFGANSSSALAAFVETADDLDEEALRALENELRKRRQQGRST